MKYWSLYTFSLLIGVLALICLAAIYSLGPPDSTVWLLSAIVLSTVGGLAIQLGRILEGHEQRLTRLEDKLTHRLTQLEDRLTPRRAQIEDDHDLE